MKRFTRQFIAGFLALCLAFAGAVGLNPVLHQLVEHGGQGEAHTHSGFATGAKANVHAHAHATGHRHGDGGDWHEHTHEAPAHRHDVQPVVDPVLRNGVFVQTIRPFTLPNPFPYLSKLVSRVFEGTTPDAPDSNGPGHEHHSLAQLLATGAVELHVDVPAPGIDFVVLSFRSVAPESPFLPGDWDSQTASRGPPVA